mmetsp:Transcript_15358/g.48972  ORF Transcript_15358/g.48972 Transcript_15358/m.48972 type:complete len:456 (-) Transcript_15358:223-1590(-)|eukprot:CAMPEP_0202086308 /NCGR_PEP_ID=MMETSP0964-20121228/33138_1 /ASSEMBLY_ACC=CAM_ASM_000500 /TAXON_ID=4773 /ORGANISM="Schizochytrium aggregatum, Strain ATCC28209" /LENGTH=455 /DNA_ID=CAMNT_0048654197 /DNA_START=67 /DNA_END=1434 /DNA_ORIENTATION=+
MALAAQHQQEADLRQAVEFIPGRLYYVALRNKPHKQRKAAFFSIDEELVYWNFFLDFGPLNLGQLFRFCQILRELLDDPKLRNKTIYYYSSSCPQKRANAAFLVSSFMMLFMNRTPEDAYSPFANSYPPFPPFHDATPCRCTYNLTVLDCLRGIHRAVRSKHVDFHNLNIDEYEYFERVECGDLNWIVKDKFLAFAGPHDFRMETTEGYDTLVPEDYIPYFRKTGVKLVIRLNKKCYDEQRFVRAGIKHLDLFYLDGSNPPLHILQKFLEACEAEPGAIAVHCKAGLGRTGTCIGSYMMKHYQYTAAEAIGWMRVCRPGSVIGPQQHFMADIEPVMHQEGRRFRQRSAAAASSGAAGEIVQKSQPDQHQKRQQNAGSADRRIAKGAVSRPFDEFATPESKISQALSNSHLFDVESKDEDEGEYSQGDRLLSQKSAAMQRLRLANQDHLHPHINLQ